MEMTNTVNTTPTSPFGALITMFYEPTKTFAALEPRKAAWLPTVLLMLSTSALMLWYFSVVDFAWLMEQMFATIKNAEEREKAMSMMTLQMMKFSTLASAVIGLPIMLALTGVYFMIAGKVMSKEFSFGSGFSLAAWGSVPSLLTLPLGAMQMLLASNGQLSFSDLNPTSLNTLFFQYELNHPLAGLLDSVSVSSVWTAILLVIGFQVWAKVARATAIKVVLIPYVTIYGIWIAFALSKAA